ncbi:prolyl oligopeptidase family serine peptidase [Granulicella sibirica]|uniref:prolyl oligopeptidase n=1 Tax=Granulicella sibirica TaxID=2479048 RepID=A0A4Q0T5C7_9BACT|nr:prolyl oligopeptidase family serine peptidase [Granulicella sibirica]RXH58923.1 Prolyl endopeptidase [Granulicella sibirica]
MPDLTYPPARKVDQTDTYFGTEISDPYRWMEDVDAPELKQWVDAENALTQSWLDEVPQRESLRTRLMALTNYERYSAPTRHGTRYFYSHNTGLQNQAILFWQEGLDGTPHVLIDPNTLSTDGTVALNGISITDDGTLMDYAISDAGSDWVKWRVRDIATGQDLPDIVEWSKFSSATWLKDNSGFFYQGYERPADITPEDALKSANYFHKIYFHKLGTPQSEDLLIFDRPDDRELNMGCAITDDGRYLIISQSRGTSPNNQVTIKDLTQPDSSPILLVTTEEAAFDPIDNDGSYFWFRTTLDAPNSKVIGIDLAQQDLTNPSRDHWQTLIPESTNPLDSVSMVHNTLIAQYLKDAQSHIQLHAPTGELLHTFALPAIGTADGFDGKRTDTETFFTFTNFTTPATVYRLDLTTLETTPYRRPNVAFDPSLFETRQVFYPSKDGTRIPLFLTHRKGITLDGQNPTLLYGYGGFNIALPPAFAPAYVLWMEMGGIYAQAGLRGGGEYGEAWHEAGTKLKKQNVFDDFIAAAEYLIAERYTSPAKLAISGGSNGGLLVGACELQRPDLFAAAIAQVAVMDMLRFDKFTIGWAWKADYGSPSENEEEFRAIYRYSPLHNIVPGRKYPATLITTADHDDRVFPAHSFKYAAALQAAAPPHSEANPLLIRIETRAGHGAGMPLSKRVELTADQYAFLTRTLEMCY